MKLIIELEGPVLDVEPVYWAAYSRAVAEIGWARQERTAFWQATRRGGGMADILTGAKPRHVQCFQVAFPAALESDACWEEAHAADEVNQELRALVAGQHTLVLVTLGANAAARQQRLDAEELAIHFTRMTKLTGDGYQRRTGLGEMVGEDRRVVVVAASEPMVQLAAECGLPVVGMSNGSCTVRRLTRAGTSVTFRNLAELGEDLVTGARRLAEAGVAPAPLMTEPPRQEERRSSPGRRSGGRRYSRRRW